MSIPLRFLDLDSRLVRFPQYAKVYGSADGDTPVHRHRIHVTRDDDNGAWTWVLLLRAVAGWKVIAAGDFPADRFDAHEAAGDYVEDMYKGPGGDYFDYLPSEDYMVYGRGTIAHIKRPDVRSAYCGDGMGSPAVFNTQIPGHAEQHCIACTDVYRAEHWGRTPLVAH